MNCYICEKTPGPSGTHYHVKTAIGICHNCGIAVCKEHSQRDTELESPLLCPSCAKLLKATMDNWEPDTSVRIVELA
jgi:hypothetical protein